MKKKVDRKGFLLGVGLDHTDGHKRITQAEEFCIVGGSQETHERMSETAIKTFEDLRNRGKSIDNVEREELADIIHKHSSES